MNWNQETLKTLLQAYPNWIVEDEGGCGAGGAGVGAGRGVGAGDGAGAWAILVTSDRGSHAIACLPDGRAF